MFTCFLVGNGSIAIRASQAIIHSGYSLNGVYSFDGSLSQWAERCNVKHFDSLENLKQALESQAYDYLFSINNPWIIPNEVITHARRSTINYHDSLLPRYSGLYATSWALINGEQEHGLSFHEVNTEIDAGAIYKQAHVKIADDDTAISLNTRIHDIAIESFSDLLREIAQDSINPFVQDTSLRSYYSNADRPDCACLLSMTKPAKELYNLVRGLTFGHSKNPLGLPKIALTHKIISVGNLTPITKSQGLQPGEIVDVSERGLLVAVQDSIVELSDLKTLSGTPIYLEDLITWGGVKGSQLREFGTTDRDEISTYNRRVCIYEPKWINRLSSALPFVHPYCTNVNDEIQTTDQFVEISALENRELATQQWLAVFATYCTRLSQQEFIHFGLAVTDIPTVGKDIFANTVPFCVSLSETNSYLSLITTIGKELALCQRWKTVAYDVIARYPELSELESYPHFSTTVAILATPEQLNYDHLPNADLLFVVYLDNTPPTLILSGSIKPWQGQAIATQIATIAVTLTQDSTQSIGSVSLINSAQREQLLNGWCITHQKYPQHSSVNELISAQAKLTPDALAVSGENTTLTYLELENQSNQLAHALIKTGVVAGELIGVCLERGPDLITCILGIIKTGSAYVPIDPNYPIGRIEHIVSDSGIKTVITQTHLLESLSHTTNNTFVDPFYLDKWDAVQYPSTPINNATPESLLYVIYTSGSTGKPKGVEIRHSSLINHSLAIANNYQLGAGDKMLQSASISFDVAAEQIFPSLFKGAEVVIPSFNPLESFTRFEQLAVKSKITAMILPTAFWHQWVIHLENTGQSTPPMLRSLSIGTEKALGHRLDAWQQLSKGKVAFFQGYGPTETTVTATMYQHKQDKTFGVNGEIPIGQPLPNIEVYVVDKKLELVPVGIPGELLIGGAGLAAGYRGQPELTAEKFIQNPFKKGSEERVYKTGDWVRRGENGDIFFVGREDQQIKIRGFRVEIGEIESALQALQVFEHSIVLPVRDNHGVQHLVAYTVSRSESCAPDFDLIVSKLADQLPDYMVPAKFIALDKLPMTHNNKVDRHQLLKMSNLDSNLSEYEAPSSEAEKRVAEIWSTHLELKKISRGDSFFALGGDSLRLLSVIDAIERSFGVLIPFSQMYKSPTLAKFCENLPNAIANSQRDKRDHSKVNTITHTPFMLSPIPNARMGRDLKGAPKWYISHPEKTGRHIELLGYGFDSKGKPKNDRNNLKVDMDWGDIASNETWPNTLLFKVDKYLDHDQIIDVDFDPFRSGEVRDVQPMTLQQKEVWLAASSGTNASKAFNLTFEIKVQGNLDIEAIKSAIEALHERHESLRTTFYGPQMLACIARDFCIHVPCYDVKNLASNEKSSHVEKLKEIALNTDFDLTFGPLMAITLVSLKQDKFVLIVTVHHIIADGWSLNILTNELGKLYSAQVNNTHPALSPAGLYSQYNLDQQYYRQSHTFSKVESYWLDQFSTTCPVLELPLAKPRPSYRTFNTEHIEHLLPAELLENISHRCAEGEYTFFTYMYAAYVAFIYRLTGQKDIVIGVPFAGQALAQNGEALVGHCVNILPIRTTLSDTSTFSLLLEQVHNAISNAFDNSQFSYVDVLERINLDRDVSRSPLVAATFNVYHQKNNLDFEGLATDWNIIPRHFSNFELVLDIFSSADTTQIHCDFNQDLFDKELVQHWLSCYEILITRALETPDCKIDKLELISNEYKSLLAQSNLNRLEIPTDTLHELISKQAMLNPDRLAVSFEETRYNYNELNQLSNQLAHFLIDKGISVGALIGLCVDRSDDMLIALLGILKAGAGYVPLDPEYPQDRIEYILDNAKAPLLISESGKLSIVPEHAGETMCLDTLWPQIKNQSTDLPITDVTPDHVAYVIYTSGSTGNPKGVQVTHKNVVNFLCAMQQRPGITIDDKILAVTTVSFDIAVLELYLPLTTGAAVDIVSRDTAMNANRLASRLVETNATMLQATPATWRMLLDSGWSNQLPLKALVGGEALPKDLVSGLLSNTTELWNMYGPTETTVWSTCYRIVDKNAPILIGTPIGNTQVYVLDSFSNPVIPGSYGELYIGGLGVSKGYLHLPAMNRERFIQDIYSNEGSKLYRTGDQVRRTLSGDLEYITRLDNQIKIRGYRIELGEIETALTTHQKIQQAIVVVREEGAGDIRLVAYYIADQASGPTPDAIRQHLRQSLPSYMVPQFFVELDAIPMTPNGKIDRKQLPAPGSSSVSPKQKTVVEPRNDFERAILTIWEKQLGDNKLGITDNFFDSGGHSILAMQTIMEMSAATGVDFEYSMIFSFPTIEQLVDALGKDAEKQSCSVVPLQSSGEKPPIFCVCGIEIYRSLANALGNEQPVLGVYAHEELALVERALSGQSYNVSVESLANAYIEGIQKQNNKGPYQLVGISFGGFLAVQIAKKLQRRGHKIDAVILLDTILPSAYERNILQSIIHKIKSSNILKSLRGKNRNKTTPDKEMDAATLRERCFIEAFYDKQSTAERYDGNVILVKAEETARKSSVKLKNDYGWKDLLCQAPQIVSVPGDHLGMIKGSNAKITARELKQLIVSEN